MSFSKAYKALMTLYEDLSLGLPTAYEGVKFDPPDQADWAAVYVLPAINEPVTLGKQGEDEETGILQIDLMVPMGKSVSVLHVYADTVQAIVVPGKGFTYDDQIVNIESVSRARIVIDGGWLKLSISINWNARYNRPDF